MVAARRNDALVVVERLNALVQRVPVLQGLIEPVVFGLNRSTCGMLADSVGVPRRLSALPGVVEEVGQVRVTAGRDDLAGALKLCADGGLVDGIARLVELHDRAPDRCVVALVEVLDADPVALRAELLAVADDRREKRALVLPCRRRALRLC